MNWDNVFMLVAAIIGSGGTTAVVSAIIAKNNAKKQASCADQVRQAAQVSALIVAVMLILQDRIDFIAHRAIEIGYVSEKTKKFVKKAHAAYKSLGGNGDLDDVMEDFEELPVKYDIK